MTTPPLHNTDDQSIREQIAIDEFTANLVNNGYTLTEENFQQRFNETRSAILSLLAEAHTQTAETILHRGYCIPEMETQVEDYIAALRQKESK